MNDTSGRIRYLSCDQLDDDLAYRAARAGFSDYVLPFTMSRREFDSRFWGPEGNIRDISWVALDREDPVGLVLSGIRIYDGMNTMRCGMLGVAPEFRGTGVAGELMNRHAKAAARHRCDRFYLEVIRGNDRAIAFYTRLGYVETGIISYFTFPGPSVPVGSESVRFSLRPASFEEVAGMRREASNLHLHWQREMDSLALSDYQYRILESGGRAAGAIAWNSRVIPFLYVVPGYRRRGMGRYMLNHVLEQLPEGEKMMLSFVDDDGLEQFCLDNGGERDKISQFEMVRSIPARHPLPE